MTQPIEQACESGACITPTRHGAFVQFTSDPNPYGNLRGWTTLAEAVAFFDQVKAGIWDHIGADEAVA